MNNKGQTLVIFTLLLPLLLLVIAYTVENSLLFYQKNKLYNNVKSNVISDINSKILDELEISNDIRNNDKDINNLQVEIENNYIYVYADKKVNSIFGSIIKIKDYTIKVNYKKRIEGNNEK